MGIRTAARPSTLLAVIALLSLSVVQQAPADDRADPPDWYREHIEFLSRAGGEFHADNSAHVSSQEPWDAFGLEWRMGPSGKTLRGRLFGLRDGAEDRTFWEYFMFWNPEEGKAVVFQEGMDGTVAIGSIEPMDEEGSHRLEQTLFAADGTEMRIAHVSVDSGDVHTTQSFSWVDGAWEPQRSYRWTRTGKQAEPTRSRAPTRPGGELQGESSGGH